MSIGIPRGFRMAGVTCGIKRNASKQDLTLVVSDAPCVAAGVYTQNVVVAAPVKALREQFSELQFCFRGDEYGPAMEQLHQLI